MFVENTKKNDVNGKANVVRLQWIRGKVEVGEQDGWMDVIGSV